MAGCSREMVARVIEYVLASRRGDPKYPPNAIQIATEGALSEWNEEMSTEEIKDLIEKHIVGVSSSHHYCDARVLNRPSFGISKYGEKQMLLCGGRLDTNDFICPECGKDYNAAKRTTKE